MCYVSSMTAEFGLREMRQQASDLVRRAEAGEELTITVSGRPAAVLGPVRARRWHGWADVADVFAGPGDPTWADDRDLVDQAIEDPWA
jgi:prevent-host-death family protein